MNIKVKWCLVLLLLYLSQEINSCSPCVCKHDFISFPDTPNRADHPWYYERNQGRRMQHMYCGYQRIWNAHEIYDLPWDIPAHTEAMELRGHMAVCKHNGITRAMFQKFTKLQFLVISHCQAKTVEVDFVTPFGNNLMELYIVSNSIVDVPVGMFQKAPNLHAVDLFNNNVVTIQNGLFANMKQLIWVAVHGNKINKVEVGAFKNTPKLRWINIRWNMLTYVDVNILENKKVFVHAGTHFDGNPYFCNEELCPFMHYAKKGITCTEPLALKDKPFGTAINVIGTKVDRVRHSVEVDSSVQMECTTCSYTKLNWLKEGSEQIPADITVTQAQGSRTSILKIAKVKEEHDGNYTCFNPDCKEGTLCPRPVVNLYVELIEPLWNFTDSQGKIDGIIRYGSSGFFYGLIPLSIYAICMAVAMSIYWIYIEQKKRNLQQPEPEQE